MRRHGATPIVDAGLIDALKSGTVTVTPQLQRLTANGAILAGGTFAPADAIIAATGYRTGLHPLVGYIGVLDQRGLPWVHGAHTLPSAPRLRFVGFTNPISGNLRELYLRASRPLCDDTLARSGP